MFSQSLVAVFKQLAEFHGYVAVRPTAPVQTQPSQQPAQTVAVTTAAKPLCCQA
jgi:hypothetical protein